MMKRVHRLAVGGLVAAQLAVGTAAQAQTQAPAPPPPTPPPPDTTKPEIRGWLSNGVTVSGFLWDGRTGTRSCEIRVRDNVAIKKVVFELDGQFLNEEVNPPYTCIWNTTNSRDGQHQLRANVYDTADNLTFTSRLVNVRNVEPPRNLPPQPPTRETPTGPVGGQGGPVAPAPAPVPTPTPAPPPPLVGAPAPVVVGTGGDAVAPRVRFSARPARLRTVLRSGLTVPVRCSEGCDLVLSLYHRGERIGTGRGSLSSAGRRAVRIRVRRGARRTLGRSARPVVLLRGSATDSAGNRRVFSRRILLR